MIARSAPSPSSPAPSARRYAALGLDRSARPSKGDTMPQMRAGRCSPVLKIHARQTTSDRSSAGFLSFSWAPYSPQSPALSYVAIWRASILRAGSRITKPLETLSVRAAHSRMPRSQNFQEWHWSSPVLLMPPAPLPTLSCDRTPCLAFIESVSGASGDLAPFSSNWMGADRYLTNSDGRCPA